MSLLKKDFLMNNFYPSYFFLFLLSYSKEKILPCFLFATLFLDLLVYKLPFIHTIVGLLFYFFNVSWKSSHRLKNYLLRTLLNTFFYLSFLSLITESFSLFFFITNVVFNLLFTILLFNKKKLNFSKK